MRGTKMDVIVIFDLYGYDGQQQMVDVVAVPNGKTDQDVFDAWASARSRAAATHAFLSTTLRTLDGLGGHDPWYARAIRWVKNLKS